MRKVIVSAKVYKKIHLLNSSFPNVETGGFLFGRTNPMWIEVLDVSHDGENAQRSYSSVTFDNQSLLEFTKEKVKEKQYIVGTWHSHPLNSELIPSRIDNKTMKTLNSFYEKGDFPIFFITKIRNGELLFNIYMIDLQGEPMRIKEYEIEESE